MLQRFRPRMGVGCPFCAGKKPSVTNSLTSLYPEIAKEWHPERNGTLTPGQVVAGSNRKVWWRCTIDPSHSWEAKIVNRTKLGRGCPACKSGWTVEVIREFVRSLMNHLSRPRQSRD